MNRLDPASWLQALRWQALKQRWKQWKGLESPAYRAWRRQFLAQRLRAVLTLAIATFPTFAILRFTLSALGITPWNPSWFLMAACIELGLLFCLFFSRTQLGRHHPVWIFLGCSWTVTLMEQIWATTRGEVFTGLFAWTLTFLAQATFIPVCWSVHVVSQLGVFFYYVLVNGILRWGNPDQAFWNPAVWLYFFWFCCICNISVFLHERLQRSEFHARRELEAEQKKSERLLLNILPETVARQLKKEHRTIAEHFPEVTVLFADIVGFTRMSAQIPPEEMVTLLNQIFSTFDYLAEHHGLEKIKTIGDSYMVVGGLPLERHGHVAAIAQMALDMQGAIAQFNLQLPPERHIQPFSMRIGIHTGPVVAGVIGVKKFIYDLWGDTVNIASRMESQGLAGKIQVTEAVYESIQDQFMFEERGIIHVKGKGDMKTYLLQCRKH